MLCHSSRLITTVFITSFFMAGTALGQEPEGGVAPAPVELEEEGEGEEAPAAAPGAAAPAAAPDDTPTLEEEPDPTATAGVALGATASPAAAAAPAPSVVLGAEAGPANAGGVDVGTGGWTFGFHGYFRAPFRSGIASREPSQRTGLPTEPPPNDPVVGAPETIIPPPGSRRAVLNPDGTYTGWYAPRDFDSAKAYKKTTFHIPQVPDDQFLSWQHTSHNPTDWAELFFSVSSPIAEGTLSVEGYSFTQSAYADPETQFGVAQGWVTIKPPLPWDNVKITAKAGSFTVKYGMSGRYDAGEYDTYLFGRTKVMGGLLREQFQLGKIRLAFEEGFGGRRPHPSKYNTAKFSLLSHNHAFLEYQNLMVGLHFLHTWAQEEDRDGQGCPGPGGINDETGYPSNNSTCQILWGTGPAVQNADGTWSRGAHNAYGGAGDSNTPVYPVGSVAGYGAFGDGADANVWLPDGQMTIVGPEIKLDTQLLGLFYLGGNAILARNALTVAPSVEILHSNGGGEFSLGVTNQYLDNPACNPAKGECSTGGTGNIYTGMFQWEFGLQNFIRALQDRDRFWGEGRDFVMKNYVMLNIIDSQYDVYLDGSLGAKNPYGEIGSNGSFPYYAWPSGGAGADGRTWIEAGDNYSKQVKVKFGTDLYGSLFSAMAVGLRFDHLKPNNHLPNQAFSIISPRIEFRSRWVTREKIVLQYSRYMYAKRECDVGRAFNPYAPLSSPYEGDPPVSNYDFPGSPQNFSGYPANQDCVQIPSGPRLPEGWGATSLEATTNWRGAPITGGNPNSTRPDENVINLTASMWW
ncbi:MAG: hypothetical protein JW751_26295 [Polyangiaceae bacterium]|nr:hypothetical protein [Polyangiaceae bacterium]